MPDTRGPLTAAELAELRRKVESASVLPWWTEANADCWQLFADEGYSKQLIKAPRHSLEYACYWPSEADLDYLLAAANALPRLLAEVVEWRSGLRRYVPPSTTGDVGHIVCSLSRTTDGPWMVIG